MRLTVGAASHQGLVRRSNEDAYCWCWLRGEPPALLAAVADGMGGHQAGEVASATAVKVLRSSLEATWSRKAAGGSPPDYFLVEAMRTVFEEANSRVAEMSSSDPSLSGMGTTLSAVLILDGCFWVGHVGDSRVYLIKKGVPYQLTSDHSLVAELVRKGEISGEEALQHPYRHILTRAIGGGLEAGAETLSGTLSEGDVLLLCTDGVSNLVYPEEMVSVLEKSKKDQGSSPGSWVETAAWNLLSVVNRRGGDDNATVIIIEA